MLRERVRALLKPKLRARRQRNIRSYCLLSNTKGPVRTA